MKLVSIIVLCSGFLSPNHFNFLKIIIWFINKIIVEKIRSTSMIFWKFISFVEIIWRNSFMNWTWSRLIRKHRINWFVIRRYWTIASWLDCSNNLNSKVLLQVLWLWLHFFLNNQIIFLSKLISHILLSYKIRV